jgi:hypothetical protein
MRGPLTTLLIATAVTLCSSCFILDSEYTDHNGKLQSWPHRHYLVDVTTDPPGAPINVDGEFCGKSPAMCLVPRSRAIRKAIRIEALPFTGGQFTQLTFLDVSGRDWTTPIKVFLNMRLENTEPTHRYEFKSE